MSERNHGLDLLRLVLMYMVCVLHILGQGGMLNATVKGSANYAIFWFLEIIAYSAVDTFALISGYTAKNQKLKYEKIVNMWFQAFFYSFILTLFFVITGIAKFIPKEMIKLAFPVTFQSFWYFTAYFGLFLVIPILNKFIFSISEITAKKAFIVTVVIFIGLGIIYDPFHTEGGYSMLWLTILYILGGLAKKIHLFESRKTSTLLLWLSICILLNWIILFAIGLNLQIHYLSPTIVSCALIQVILFTRISFSAKIGMVISNLSKLAFGIYLFQQNHVIWNQIKDRFVLIAEVNPLLSGLYALLAAGALFLIGLYVETIRSILHQKLHIPQLCNAIVKRVQIIVDKLVVSIR